MRAGRRIAALSVVLASCVAADAQAQTCGGGISFNFAPLQLGVAAASSSRGVAASASLAYGSDRLFAAGSGLVADGGRASRAGVTVGVDQAVRRDNRLHVCPTVTASYARSDGERRADVGAHIASGWVARNRPGLVVVPAFGVSIGNGAASAVGVRADRVTGAVDAAVGIIVRSRYAFTPRVIVGWRRGEMVIAAAMGFTIHVGHE